MTERSEALAQLSRILGDAGLRSATPEKAREAVRSKLSMLIDGIVAEAAQSDDVFDRDSGLAYVELRLQQLADLIGPGARQEALDGAREQISQW